MFLLFLNKSKINSCPPLYCSVSIGEQIVVRSLTIRFSVIKLTDHVVKTLTIYRYKALTSNGSTKTCSHVLISKGNKCTKCDKPYKPSISGMLLLELILVPFSFLQKGPLRRNKNENLLIWTTEI
jgi:hypothetical protein